MGQILFYNTVTILTGNMRDNVANGGSSMTEEEIEFIRLFRENPDLRDEMLKLAFAAVEKHAHQAKVCESSQEK